MYSAGLRISARRVASVIRLIVWTNLWTYFGLRGADGLILAPVYWNSSNPMFKPSINNPVIEVQLRDEIDFVCPWDPTNSTDPSAAEYYVIYQVSKAEYDSCSLFTSNRKPLLIVNCSALDGKSRRFTVIFEPYQSIPNVPEYRVGMTYYYTTTSTGKLDGLENRNNGACQDYNMKLAFYICCLTSVTSRASVGSSPTQPRIPPASSTTNNLDDSRTTQSFSEFVPPTPARRTTTTLSTLLTKSSTTSLTTVSSTDTETKSVSRDKVSNKSTTKITQLPQPGYQQTSNGCQLKTAPITFLSALTLSLFRLLLFLLYSRT